MISLESIRAAKAAQLAERRAVELATGWVFEGDVLRPRRRSEWEHLGVHLGTVIAAAVCGPRGGGD